MKKQRKKYKRPLKPWDKQRLEEEEKVMKRFGLRRKRELWKAQALLRKYRRMAREAAAKKDENLKSILIKKLYRLGILNNENAELDDVLKLSVEDILKRRLQTIVYEKKFANTIKQARQFIVHNKVKINGRVLSFPSYLVPREEENLIEVDSELLSKIKRSNVPTDN